MHEDGTARAPRHKIPESVLVIIHTVELEVLLIERVDHPGYWQSVTGSKDWPEETLAATAVREVGEETGIVVGGPAVPRENLRDWASSIQYNIYPRWLHRYAPGVTRNTEHRFSLQVPRDIPVTLDPREHTAWRWLPWQDAAAACYSPSNAAAIRALPDHLGPVTSNSPR